MLSWTHPPSDRDETALGFCGLAGLCAEVDRAVVVVGESAGVVGDGLAGFVDAGSCGGAGLAGEGGEFSGGGACGGGQGFDQ